MKLYRPTQSFVHYMCCLWSWRGWEAAAERAWPTLPYKLSDWRKASLAPLRLTPLPANRHLHYSTVCPPPPSNLGTLGVLGKDSGSEFASSCRASDCPECLRGSPPCPAVVPFIRQGATAGPLFPEAPWVVSYLGAVGHYWRLSPQQWHQETKPGCSLPAASARLLGILSRVEHHNLVASLFQSFHGSDL